MVKLEPFTFKLNLLWHACCPVPSEEKMTVYYDDQPVTFEGPPIIFHTVGLTKKRAKAKLHKKLYQYYSEKEKNKYAGN